MKNSNLQINYTLNIDTPVLQIPEIETKFGVQIYSNSLLIFLEDINQARIVQQLHFWLRQKHGVMLNGIRWIWKSMAEWIKDALPDLTPWKIRVALGSLVDRGILIREQFHKEHRGHNYNPKNRIYYYTINYARLNSLITEKLQSYPELVNNHKTRSVNNHKTRSVNNHKTRSVDNHTTRFVNSHKTDQYNDQYKQTNIYKQSSTNVFEAAKEESSQSLSSQFSNKDNSSLANKVDREDKPSAHEVQSNTLRGTTRKYDTALGIVAPQERKKVQDWTWDWLPDGAWAIEGKLDSAFHSWLAQKWQQEHGGDIHMHRRNVLSHFKKDPANLAIAWLSYQEETKHRYENVATRIANGVEIKPEEQKLLVARSRAITEQLPDEINPVSKPLGLIGNGVLTNNCGKPINLVGNGDGKPTSNFGDNPLVPRSTADDVTSDSSNLIGNGVLTNDCGKPINLVGNGDGKPTFITLNNAPEGAEGAEAYHLYQPEKIDRPVDKKSLFEKLRNLTTKFSFPEVAKRKPETPDLESLSIAQINELIANDPILAKGWLPYLFKSDQVDVVLNEARELLYVEEPF